MAQETHQNVANNRDGVTLREAAADDQLFEQIPAAGELKHEVDLGVRLERVVELDNALVLHPEH